MKSLVLVCGKFNPLRSGHCTNITAAEVLASSHKLDLKVYTTSVGCIETEPLPEFMKLDLLRKVFPSLSMNSYSSSFISLIKSLEKDYKQIFYACSSDEADHYQRLFDFHNGKSFKYDRIVSWPTGPRDYMSSGEKMRQFAKDDNFDSFRVNLPWNIQENEKESKLLFDIVKRNFHNSCHTKTQQSSEKQRLTA